jgi:hypothetical protein
LPPEAWRPEPKAIGYFDFRRFLLDGARVAALVAAFV